MITSMRISLLLLCLAFPVLCIAEVVEHHTIDVSARQKTFKCADNCRLSLCNLLQVPRLTIRRPQGSPNLLRGAGFPMGGGLCNKRKRQLVDVKSGEALVGPVKGSVPKVPISMYSPAGLSPSFPKKYLKFREILGRESRIVRGKSVGNQNEFANDLCVTIPIKRYRVLNRDGTTGPVVKTSNPKDCVSLKAGGSKLQFNLRWNSTDDLDMLLEEPSGCVLSRFNKNCPSGAKLNKDNGDVTRCLPISGDRFFVREIVTYPVNSAAENGNYILRINHLRNCDLGPTAYTVTVVINGNLMTTRTGVTNSFASDVVATLNFGITL